MNRNSIPQARSRQPRLFLFARFLVIYLGAYFLLREYAARHAPYAVTRAPREWITGKPVTVELREGRILWPVFSGRRADSDLAHHLQNFERRFMQPLAYYVFSPFVEADCALNGHPASPQYDWKFFGWNLE